MNKGIHKENIRYLSISGNRMEALLIGNTGIPIVILTGLGCSFYEWNEIIGPLSETNRIIMFHRPGLGESELHTNIRNTEMVVNEVVELLDVLEIGEKIILIGHSYGGLCVQHFVNLYPHKVAGIILVDSTSVDLKELDDLELPILDEKGSDEYWLEIYHSFSLLDESELKKKVNPIITESQKKFPDEIQMKIIDFQIKPSLYKAIYLEMCSWKIDALKIKTLNSFPNVPLIVIARDKDYNIKLGVLDGLPEGELQILEEKWNQLIRDQVNLNTKSELILATNSSHFVYLDRPDVIIVAIKKVIERI